MNPVFSCLYIILGLKFRIYLVTMLCEGVLDDFTSVFFPRKCVYTHVHVELESACLSELNEDRLCIALLDRLLCVV